MRSSAMANIAIPGVAVTYGALLLCVSRASTGLSKHSMGVGPLFCLDFWDCRRACARGGYFCHAHAHAHAQSPSPPGMAIPDSPFCPVQWPVQWVLGTIKQNPAMLGSHSSLFPAFPCVLDQTMPCKVCHSKPAVDSVALAEADLCTLRQKHPGLAEDWAVCELCVRQARPNTFFSSKWVASGVLGYKAVFSGFSDFEVIWC